MLAHSPSKQTEKLAGPVVRSQWPVRNRDNAKFILSRVYCLEVAALSLPSAKEKRF